MSSQSNRRGNPMSTLTVTARNQVTFWKEVMQHLGIKPGAVFIFAMRS